MICSRVIYPITVAKNKTAFLGYVQFNVQSLHKKKLFFRQTNQKFVFFTKKIVKIFKIRKKLEIT